MNVREHLGKVAYDAYCELRGWKAYDGTHLPQWEGVRQDIKDGWIAAATAVRQAMREYIEDIKLLDQIEPLFPNEKLTDRRENNA